MLLDQALSKTRTFKWNSLVIGSRSKKTLWGSIAKSNWLGMRECKNYRRVYEGYKWEGVESQRDNSLKLTT